jgi:flagellar biosynthesis protein FlhB
MAKDSDLERTEPASPQSLEEGDIPRSRELKPFAILMACIRYSTCRHIRKSLTDTPSGLHSRLTPETAIIPAAELPKRISVHDFMRFLQ